MTRVERIDDGLRVRVQMDGRSGRSLEMSAEEANELRGALAELYDHPELEHVDVGHGYLASQGARRVAEPVLAHLGGDL